MLSAVHEPTVKTKPLTILLVVDNHEDLMFTYHVFDRARFQNRLYSVNNVDEALDFVYHQGEYFNNTDYVKPDLVLLDCNRSSNKGLDELIQLSSDQACLNTPIIVLSSMNNEDDVHKIYTYGAAHYIRKPISFGDFVNIINGFNFYWVVRDKLPALV